MPVVLWRFFAWLGILVTLALFVSDVVVKSDSGAFGLDAHFQGDVQVVDAVARDSSAAAAGIRPGDRITLTSDTLANRIRLFDEISVPGEHVAVTVERDGNEREALLVARDRPSGNFGPLLIFETIRIVLLALAALIAIRRSEDPAARALASFYIAFAFGFISSGGRYPEIVRAVFQVARPVATVYSFACLATFAAIFPAPSVTGFRRRIPHLGRIVASLGIASILMRLLGPTFARRDPLGQLDPRDWANTLSFFVQIALVATGFVLASREAKAEDRERLRWLGFSFAVGFSGVVPALALQSAGAAQDTWFLLPLTLIAVPAGSTYAILRHRVIDIGFAINRTLVFAILSSFIVFCFSLFEFVIGKYLVSIGHVQSVVIEAVLALGVALSLGRVHEIVDRFVDATLFRKRHHSELALKRLTKEVSHITDPGVLGERVVAAVVRHADVDGATIVLRDAEGVFRAAWTAPGGCSDFPAVDENDPAVVRLRTFREAVEIGQLAGEGAPSAWPGEYAFPMLVRGELTGALVCGSKHDGESLAADERGLLSDLASSVVVVLDALQTAALRRAVARALSGDGGLEALRQANSSNGSFLPPS